MARDKSTLFLLKLGSNFRLIRASVLKNFFFIGNQFSIDEYSAKKVSLGYDATTYANRRSGTANFWG